MIALYLAALLILAATPSPGSPLVRGQDKYPANTNPDNRPEVKALITELVGHIEQHGKEDREAIENIDKLTQEFPRCGPRDREATVQALNRCFQVKRQDTAEGVPDNALFLAAAVALRNMGPESAKVLMTWIGHKDHRKDIAVQEKLIQSLGRTHDEAGRKFLIKTLDDKNPRIQAAASEALGDYAESDQKLRKENFEELLKLLMQAKGAHDANIVDPIAAERYNTIAAPIVSSLQRLSKHQEHDPNEWQRWWNKNKKADWDQKGG